jgi:hypothetical protein
MRAPQPRPQRRPWVRNRAARPATVMDLLVFFTVALAGYAGAAAIVLAFSLRDLHFEPRTEEPGAPMLVQWRFFGLPVWRRHFSRIVEVEQKNIVTHAFDPAIPAEGERSHVQVAFLDPQGKPAFIARASSLAREEQRIHRFLTAPGGGDESATVRETSRWWAGNPFENFCGGAVGLLLSLAIGTLFSIGGLSALWVRVTTPASR